MQLFLLLQQRLFPKVCKELSPKAQPKPSVKKELETQACNLNRQLEYVLISFFLNGSNVKYLICIKFLDLVPSFYAPNLDPSNFSLKTRVSMKFTSIY